ncbi:MAG: hypothetical protein KDA16_00430 [Phycisphaerales bacterium]|nr:hypothetical protein [Phycisphaerales bacterium]
MSSAKRRLEIWIPVVVSLFALSVSIMSATFSYIWHEQSLKEQLRVELEAQLVEPDWNTTSNTTLELDPSTQEPVPVSKSYILEAKWKQVYKGFIANNSSRRVSLVSRDIRDQIGLVWIDLGVGSEAIWPELNTIEILDADQHPIVFPLTLEDGESVSVCIQFDAGMLLVRPSRGPELYSEAKALIASTRFISLEFETARGSVVRSTIKAE